MNFYWRRKVWLKITITFKDKKRKPVIIETYEKSWAKNDQEVVDLYMGKIGRQLKTKQFLDITYPIGKYWAWDFFDVDKIESVDIDKIEDVDTKKRV